MNDKSNNEKRKCCGIIMPISAFDSYAKEFWENILEFLKDAIREADMDPVVAWEDEKNDIIHAKILENIASMPVMIGVIMGGNSNVMLECGMRIWSNKPILLIKGVDEKLPFDVSPIQCLSLTSDCNYFGMLELKAEIVKKLKYLIGVDYKTFRSYFNIPEEVEAPKKVAEKINFDVFVKEVRQEIASMRNDIGDVQRSVQFYDRYALRYRGACAHGVRSMGVTGPTGAVDLTCTQTPVREVSSTQA